MVRRRRNRWLSGSASHPLLRLTRLQCPTRHGVQVERFTKQELLMGEKFFEKEAAVLDGDLEYGLRSFGKGFTVLEGTILKEEQASGLFLPCDACT